MLFEEDIRRLTMADEKPFYSCSCCEWEGDDPETIISLEDMPICPECHAKAIKKEEP